MSVEIYGHEYSAPFRFACMTAEAAGAPYETKIVNIMAGEQHKPDFVALNPQKKVPVMSHNGFVLSESRAIATYIALEFGKNKKLYPTDCNMAQAQVIQRMYFDMGVLYKTFGDCVYPKVFGNQDIPKEAYEKLEEALGWANDMVKLSGFAAGTDQMTIADINWVGTYSNIKATGMVKLDKYKELGIGSQSVFLLFQTMKR
uniref:Glutathione S-transferase 1, isoform C n=1 Tax=Caligus clemensi TaxID=344056 RepID=C1C305_CALCM|nr:Glutathione S-transferase 1, isoform C [Caligus clemensi]